MSRSYSYFVIKIQHKIPKGEVSVDAFRKLMRLMLVKSMLMLRIGTI